MASASRVTQEAPVGRTEHPAPAAPGHRFGRQLRWIRRHQMVIILLIVLAVLVLAPIVSVVYVSLTDNVPGGPGVTHLILSNYAALWSEPNGTALRESLITSAAGTVLAVVGGSVLAVLAARTNVPGRWMVETAGITPFFFPPLVGALAWGILGDPTSGLVNLFFKTIGLPVHVNIDTVLGVIFVFGVYYAPYTYLFVSSALRLFDPQLEEAAKVHGAGTWTTLRKVTIPALAPAVLGATLISFTLMMEDYTVPALLNTSGHISTLATRIYTLMNAVPSQPNQAAAVGMVLLVVLAVVSLLQRRMLAGRSYTTLSGKGIRARTLDLGPLRWVAFVLVLLYLLVVVVIPFLTVVNSALRPYGLFTSLSQLFDVHTMQWHLALGYITGQDFTTSLKNTLIVGVCTAVVGTLLNYLMAYVTTRTKVSGRGAIRVLAILPIGVPALLMGMGFLWTWLYVPVPVYGTLVILVIAYIARFTPQGFLSASAVLGAAHKDLEDSAVVSGASRPRAVAAVTAPLIRGGLASTALLLFLLSMRELSVALFLFTSKTVVFSIDIYNAWASGNIGQAAAISAAYSVLLLVITLCGLKWLRSST
jgi:iron(III) transport system permease protein